MASMWCGSAEPVDLGEIDGGKSMHAESSSFSDCQSAAFPPSGAFQPDTMAPFSNTSSNLSASTIAQSTPSTGYTESSSFPDCQSAAFPPLENFQPDAIAAFSYPSFNVSASTTAQRPQSNGWAARQDWSRHQALITQLYRNENKPLAEVMRIMDNQCGFRATVKMYKTQITKWGLDKKNKERDMRAIIRKNHRRADQGKRSIIRVRGQRQDFAKVVRYWNRKRVSIDDIIARETASPTPEAVECLTPSIASPIATPQALAIPEHTLRCIQDYYRGSFESKEWVKTESAVRCYTIRDNELTQGNPVMDLFNQCYLACNLLFRNRCIEAGQTLIAATAKIKMIITVQYPNSLVQLFRLIFLIRRFKRDEIALILLRQFSALGRVLLGSEHPLVRVCGWIDAAYTSGFDDLVLRCLEITADQFEIILGPMHTTSICTRLNVICLTQRENAVPLLEKLLDQCEKEIEVHDARLLAVHHSLAYGHFNNNNYIEARRLGQKNIACVQHISSEDDMLFEQAEGLYLVAMCEYALNEVNLGIETLREAIDLYVSTVSLQDGLVRKWLMRLEEWYLEQGCWSAAAETQDWRLKMLASLDTE